MSERRQRIDRVLAFTLVANIVVAVGKVAVGAVTASLAMIADGIHSSLDATSNVIGLIGNAIASRPPDEDHPYGHRRFESLASLLIGGVLLLTAWEIVQQGVNRILNPVETRITALNFVVMIVGVIINIVVSTYERSEGQRLDSELLLADADHTRSDVFVSLAVLGSLAATQFGLTWMDPAAALVVVVIIAFAAWRITQRSARILVDRAALNADQVGAIVAEVAGVEDVSRVRTRGPQDDVYVDVDVSVAAPMTTQHSSAVEREIGTRLRHAFDGVREVQVRFVPLRDAPLDYALMARAEADALGLGVHEVMVSDSPQGRSLKMHVEVDPSYSVRQAHTIVTDLEARLVEALPEVTDILTHIEPAADADAHRYDDSAEWLARRAIRIAQQVYTDGDWHQMAIYAEADGGFVVTMHCHVPGDMMLYAAHNMAEEVEARIRADLPQIHRVMIHTEPPEG